jgi:fatty acid desaturase
MESSPVPEARVRREAVKFWLVLILWPLYLFFLPPAWTKLGAAVLVYMIFPGVYLFTWIGFLMHESWHKYVPGLPSDFLYTAYALMLLSDPQLYRMTHGYHHSKVHTYEDAEFHPVGEIRNRVLRILYNGGEVLTGVAWLVVMAAIAVPFDPRFKARYRAWKPAAALAFWIAYYGGIGFLSHRAFGVPALQVALSFAVSIWLNSFLLHHSQLIEHGNLYADGTLEERNLWTRNLRRDGILERIVLFFTHGDSQEHVLHHTLARFYLRPFPGVVPLPEKAVCITLRDYLGILGRMLAGRPEYHPAADSLSARG